MTGHSIETVRGNLGDTVSGEVLEFWESEAGFAGDAALERLAEVVCVLRGPGGEVEGVNSAFPRSVAAIGGREFFVYRSLIAAEAVDRWEEMALAAWEALDGDFDPEGGGPIGLCVPVSDPEEIAARPLAVWPLSQLRYAGYTQDGIQIRIRYFQWSRV